MTIKISSFNINSIKMRSAIVTNWLDETQTDILLMQETKSIDENFPHKEFEDKGFNVIFSGQKAYNGVAIASKFKIEEISRNLPIYNDDELKDDQARFLHVKILNINIICLYLPNGNPAPGLKFDYKINWMKRLIKYSREIYNNNEPLILGGDFNVIQNNNDCYGINQVELVIFKLPDIVIEEERIYCLNTFPAIITLEGGILNGFPNSFFYYWKK
jgi:exodeoxyribonuclease-3